MKLRLILFFISLFFSIRFEAQVIYERLYGPGYPSIEHPFELSDTSSVSFANNGSCNELSMTHIDKDGNILLQQELDFSTQNLSVRKIGFDSLMVSYRQGGPETDQFSYFNVLLWTPYESKELLHDSLSFGVWENLTNEFKALLFVPPTISYQLQDTLYARNTITQQFQALPFTEGLIQVLPVHDNLLVVPTSGDIRLLDHQLQEVLIWNNITHPIHYEEAVIIDSFVVGKHLLQPRQLFAINAYDQAVRNVDLTPYLDVIDTIQSRENFLFIKGVRNNQNHVLLFNSQFDLLINETLDVPQTGHNFSYTFYPDRVYAWAAHEIRWYDPNYRVVYPYQDASPIQYVEFSFDSLWIDSFHVFTPEMHLPASVYFTGQVSNFSDDTIRSVVIHYEQFDLFTCFPFYRHMELTGLNILPGEEGLVSFEDISYQVASNVDFFRTYYMHDANHHLEENQGDNEAEVFLLKSSTSHVDEILIYAYPNPFYDEIIGNEGVEKMELFNSSGQLVASGEFIITNVSHLSPGFYFLKAISKFGIQSTVMTKAR